MRQVTRKGLMTVAAATGVLAATGGYAHADSGASGASSNSPGVLSGNTVQAPVHVPVNVCGNTVNVVGLLNPAMGNKCVNHGGGGSSAYGHGAVTEAAMTAPTPVGTRVARRASAPATTSRRRSTCRSTSAATA